MFKFTFKDNFNSLLTLNIVKLNWKKISRNLETLRILIKKNFMYKALQCLHLYSKTKLSKQ